MFVKLLIFVVCIFFSQFVTAQKIVTKAEVLTDLNYLYSALKANHPAAFKFHSEQQFDSLKTVISIELPNTMEIGEAFFRLRTFIAYVCDAHTQVLNQPKDKDKRVLSAEFETIARGLYLKRNKVDTTWNGSRIITINALPVEKILANYGTVVSGDAYNLSFKYAMAALRMGTVLKTFFKLRDSVVLELQNEKALERILVLKYDSINLLKPIKNIDGRVILRKNAHLKLIKNTDSNLVLKLSTFQNSQYKSYYATLFTYLEREKTDTLFIDLRDNTGGNFYHAFHLLNYICDDTLALTFSRKMHEGSRYFKGFQKGMRLFGFFHREVSNRGKIKKVNGVKFNTNYFNPIAHHHFKGKVVVLTNGLSMSSSTIVTYYLKHKSNAIIIGEPGGGEFGNCGGAYPKIKLPNTRMKIRFPSYWMNYNLK